MLLLLEIMRYSWIIHVLSPSRLQPFLSGCALSGRESKTRYLTFSLGDRVDNPFRYTFYCSILERIQRGFVQFRANSRTEWIVGRALVVK